MASGAEACAAGTAARLGRSGARYPLGRLWSGWMVRFRLRAALLFALLQAVALACATTQMWLRGFSVIGGRKRTKRRSSVETQISRKAVRITSFQPTT